MIRPVPSTSVVIIGPETTAGSIPIRRSTRGSTEATSDDQRTIAAAATATVSATSGPTPRVHARSQPTVAIVTAISAPVVSSLRSTFPTSRSRTCPTAIARIRVVVICVPALPPVPMSSGTKNASAMTVSSSSSNARSTVPVYISAMNRTSIQTIRFRHSSHGDARRYGTSSGCAPPWRTASSVASSSTMSATSSGVSTPSSWPSATTGRAVSRCRCSSRAAASWSAVGSTVTTSSRIRLATCRSDPASTRSRNDTTPSSTGPASSVGVVVT
jgi:hypothetical protein